VGIGTSSPDTLLEIVGADPILTIRDTETAGASTNATLRLAETGASDTLNDYWDINYTGLGALAFKTKYGASVTEAMRIDSSGNLLVGKSGSSFTTAGVELAQGGTAGKVQIQRSSSPLALVNLTDDGNILNFYKGTTAVGSIGTNSAVMYLGSDDVGLRFDATSNALSPWNTTTAALNDGGIDLGRTTGRFKDLYLSGGVYLGGTGAANKLDDYEEGTWTGTLAGETTAGASPTASGTYVKVGAVVSLSIKFNNVDITGADGRLNITGLPFAAAYEAGTGSLWNNRLPSGTPYRGFLAAGTTTVKSFDGDGSSVSFESSGSGTYSGFTLTYRTNA